jgi:hypothetical protein
MTTPEAVALVTSLGKDECSLIADALESLNPDTPAAARQARDLADLFTRLSQIARGERR